MRPMLALPSVTPGVPPVGELWRHEVKWDGVRIMSESHDGRLELFNRTERPVGVTYPELTDPAAELPGDLLVDGEVVVLDGTGLPSFSAVGRRMHVREAIRAAGLARTHPATYMVFDLLRLQGRDLIRLPWHTRRDLLESLDLPRRTGGRWQVPAVHADGAALAARTAAQGLEGVVSKRVDSRYRPGERSPDWVKSPHRHELVAVIGGWAPERGSEDRLGVVWVGHPDHEEDFGRDGILYPVARVGSGLSHAARASLLSVLRQIERPEPPFAPVPADPQVGRARWVEPAICVQIRYLGAGAVGALRQPVMRALRPEVTPIQAPQADLWDLPG